MTSIKSMQLDLQSDLDLAVKSLKGAFLICDLQLNVMASNEALAKFLQISESEIEGKNLIDLVDLETRAECIKMMRKTAFDGLARTVIEANSDSIFNKCEISRIGSVLLLQIFETSEFQEQAESSSLRLREILKNLNVWIVILDEMTGIAELTFPDGTHFFQERFIERLSIDKQVLITNAIDELYENGFATIVAPDESGQRIIKTSISFATDGPRGERKILSINSDVTEKIQYEEILVRKEQMAQIQKFAQGVAHDFGNISQSMRGFAELLINLVEDKNGKRILENLLIATNRALKVSKKISEISRIQILENSNFDLVSYLVENFEYLKSLVNSNINFNFHINDLPIRELGMVYVNPSQIERIIENIIENADQAMSGTGQIDLFCYPDSDGSNLILKIRNSGPAIPRSIADRIFMPFVTNGKDGGTGLGLYLAYEYLASCGGSIQLENQSHSVSFLISLPFVSNLKQVDGA